VLNLIKLKVTKIVTTQSQLWGQGNFHKEHTFIFTFSWASSAEYHKTHNNENYCWASRHQSINDDCWERARRLCDSKNYRRLLLWITEHQIIDAEIFFPHLKNGMSGNKLFWTKQCNPNKINSPSSSSARRCIGRWRLFSTGDDVYVWRQRRPEMDFLLIALKPKKKSVLKAIALKNHGNIAIQLHIKSMDIQYAWIIGLNFKR